MLMHEKQKLTDEITELILNSSEKARGEAKNKPPVIIEEVGWPVQCTVGPGLEGAIACETKIGYISGSRGTLNYRGYDIFDLAAFSTFEEVTYLLLHGNLPSAVELEEFEKTLTDYRFLPDTLRLVMGFPLEEMNPMAALRMGTTLMRQTQTERDRQSEELARSRLIGMDEDSTPMHMDGGGEERAIYEFSDINANRPRPSRAREDQKEARGVIACQHLISGVSTIAAAIARLRQGRLPIEPRRDLSHAGNLLYMLSGEEPTPLEERVMDVALILHADHGMNASTFAAMVVASTLSDIYLSIGSGIAALNGPLHGGANQKVVEMLAEIGEPDNVEAWYTDMRERRQKIMGFGHRVYKTYDPRARILGPLASLLVNRSESTKHKKMLATAEALETRVIDELGAKRGIFPNVDFYSGMVYSCLGIPPDFFTPLFACSRVAGWSARVLEYLKTNRIFRPRGVYVGGFNRKYLPAEERDSLR